MKDKVHKIRFALVSLIDEVFRNRFCWADCVSWAFNYRVKKWNPFNIELAKTCREESEESESACYCGRFYKGIPVDEFTREELEKVQNGVLSEDVIKSIKNRLYGKSKKIRVGFNLPHKK